MDSKTVTAGREKRFIDWLSANGAVRHPAIAIKHDPISGRGLYAQSELKSGAALGIIPYSLILTLSKARDSVLGRAVATLNSSELVLAPISDRVLMYLYLIHCKCDRTSFYYDWMQTLPTAYSDPLHWNSNELSVLAGTNMAAAAAARAKQLLRRYDSLFPHLTLLDPKLFPAADFTWYVIHRLLLLRCCYAGRFRCSTD